MAEHRIVTIKGVAELARQGLFPTLDELACVTKDGAAVYVHDQTIVVRPQGPRPEGIKPYRGGQKY